MSDTRGYTDKPAVLKRLTRIEGQVRGVERMVDENAEELIGAVTRLLRHG
jgi:DNA-binding FrmR family transcriptional regulator